MSESESFPSKELLDLIKGQVRLEGKIDNFLATQTGLTEKIEKIDARIGGELEKLDERVRKIEDGRLRERGWIGGISAAASTAMIFFVPWAKSKLGF